jgi:hypothetical protein
MAELTSSLRTFLLEEAVISTAFGQRIFVVKAPDTMTYPFAIIRIVTDQPMYTQSIESLRETIIQIDTYDESLAGCITNANMIRAKLSGYKGVIGDIEVGAVFVRDGRSEWAADARHFRMFNQFDIKWTV